MREGCRKEVGKIGSLGERNTRLREKKKKVWVSQKGRRETHKGRQSIKGCRIENYMGNWRGLVEKELGGTSL